MPRRFPLLPLLRLETGGNVNRFIHVIHEKSGEATLAFKNVTVAVPDSEDVLIEDFSLVLKPGDRLIFTGASGSGKSSLVRAIRELWDFGEGEITATESAKICCITQKAYMPDTNLRGILCYPDSEGAFTDPEMEQALKDAGLAKLIQCMPGRMGAAAVDAALESLSILLREGGVKEEAVIGGKLEETVRKAASSASSIFQSLDNRDRKRLQEGIETAAAGVFSKEQAAALSVRLIRGMEEEFSKSLLEKLAPGIESWAESYSAGAPVDRGAAKAHISRIEKQVEKNLHRFFNEKNLDAREMTWPGVWQMRHMAAEVARRMEESLEPRFAPPPGFLSAAFRCATAPFRAVRSWSVADATAQRVVSKISSVIRTEAVKGNVLSKTLSGGEQQRISFARILLHKPGILILDEITAALDESAGKSLYKDMTEKLPDTIIVSIAHNTHIMPFHTLHTHLEKKKMTVRPLKAEPKP